MRKEANMEIDSTHSIRTREPLRVLSELVGWQGHAPEVLQAVRDHITELERQGIEAINE
jgi:rifampin ADP-ribosylating transferase